MFQEKHFTNNQSGIHSDPSKEKITWQWHQSHEKSNIHLDSAHWICWRRNRWHGWATKRVLQVRSVIHGPTIHSVSVRCKCFCQVIKQNLASLLLYYRYLMNEVHALIGSFEGKPEQVFPNIWPSTFRKSLIFPLWKSFWLVDCSLRPIYKMIHS